MLVIRWAWKALGERICGIVRTCTLHQFHQPIPYQIMNEELTCVDVPATLRVDRVVTHCDTQSIVLVNPCWSDLPVAKAS